MLVEKVRLAIVDACMKAGRSDELAARAAIEAVLDEVAARLSAVQYDPAPYTAIKVRLAAMRKEVLG